MASISARLERVKDGSISLIDRGAVERACVEARHEWRERCLDPVSTLGAFAAQIAHGNIAMAFLCRRMGGRFSESAYCQARARLPVSVVRAAADAFTRRAMLDDAMGDGLWRGHRAVLIDGTGICAPDTPALREAFGVYSMYAPGCGLPTMSVLTVFDAQRDLLLGTHAAPAMTNDAAHADQVRSLLCPGDVAVGDRGLCSYVGLALLKEAEIHGVFRMSASRTMPFPAKTGERERRPYNRHRKQEPLLVRLIAENDQVVEIVKPHNRPRHVTAEVFATVPSTMVVRALRYTVAQTGWRSRSITLMTDLLDAEKDPADALAALYLSRWRIEVNLRHLKRTLCMNRLKCRSLDGVRREMLMYALVYNAVCAVRTKAAAAQGVALGRVSLIDALRWMLIETDGVPVILRPPPDLKLWPLRPPRHHPRLLKHGGHTAFRVMPKPRRDLIKAPAAEENHAN